MTAPAKLQDSTQARRTHRGPRLWTQRHVLARVVLYPIFIVLVTIGLLLGLQRRVLYPRHMIPAGIELRPLPGDVQVLNIDSPQGTIEAWFIPGRGVDDQNPGPLLIFAHGNGEIIDGYYDFLRPYREQGISMLLFEYRGYNRNPGSPTEKRIMHDLLAFYDKVVTRADVDPDRIFGHGFSLGGAVILQLAAKRPLGAAIVESTFTSVADMAWETFLVPRWLVLDRFESERIIRDIEAPVLIIHGQQDEIVPFAQALRLHHAAANSELWSVPGGHESIPRDDVYWSRLLRFLRTHNMLAAS